MIKRTVRVLALAAVSLALTAGAASAAEPMPPAQQHVDESALSGERSKSLYWNAENGWMAPGNQGGKQGQPDGSKNVPEEQPDQPVVPRVLEDVLGL
ncbi:hypothetical protein [Streptomyces sp. NPDC017993]|uniref:hypothetical protein n=1 Tax=Streptomyces sp. NPDC017993 TaxID=3365027 RepID=UPI00379A6E38